MRRRREDEGGVVVEGCHGPGEVAEGGASAGGVVWV